MLHIKLRDEDPFISVYMDLNNVKNTTNHFRLPSFQRDQSADKAKI